jgi:hypothetical protein
VPDKEKTKTQPRARAYFVRIDTIGRRPLLERQSCVELVTTFLFNFRRQQWFDLVGFVVLPRELELIIVPRTLTLNALVARLEKETTPFLASLIPFDGPVWDPEIYSEPLDGTETVRSRLHVMIATPVKLRLAAAPELYDYSSANPRYAEELDKFERA